MHKVNEKRSHKIVKRRRKRGFGYVIVSRVISYPEGERCINFIQWSLVPSTQCKKTTTLVPTLPTMQHSCW